MKTQTVRLLDASGGVLAVGRVALEGDHFGGTFDLTTLPASVRALFDEFEEIVNGQMLSFLDDIQARIAALRIKVVFDDGTEAVVNDLQLYPSTADASFKLPEAIGLNGGPRSQPDKARV